MSPQIYTVRCNPASTAQFKTTLWKGSVQIPNEIIVKVRTDFEFRAEQGFTLEITPIPAFDIEKIVGAETGVLSFTDRCTQRADINLDLKALRPGGTFPMGPRPIIRNEPARPLNPLKLLAYAALALLAAAVVYMLTRN
jgi:hypothetical protein